MKPSTAFPEPPPHNADAEVALLGAILLYPESIAKAATIVRPDDFYVTANRLTYRAMFRLHLDGKASDPVLVLSELARTGDLEEIGGREQLAKYASAATDGSNVEEYARLVREAAAKRMLDGLADGLKSAARNGVDSAAAATQFSQDIADVRTIFGDTDHVDLFEPISVTDADQTPWIARGYLARRAVTLLSALPKCGKTTIAYAIAAALQRGDPEWCGLALPEACDTLVMTEEDDSVLAETFKAVKLDPTRVPAITRRKAFPRRPLARDIDMAIHAITKRPTIGLVILDTWRFWANLPDKGSNDADIVARAFQEVARLAATGVSVLILHHSRKADGDEGTAASGSNALTGAADVLMELRRFGKGEDGTIRAIKAYGRFQRIPDEKVVELRDGQYYDLGEADKARDRMKENRVGSCLLTNGRWMTAEEVAEDTGMKAANCLASLRSMFTKHEIQRVGRGAKGSPFLYASLNVPLHQQPTPPPASGES